MASPAPPQPAATQPTSTSRDKERLTQATEGRAVVSSHLIGNAALEVRDYGTEEFFKLAQTAPHPVGFVDRRVHVYDRIKAKRQEEMMNEDAYPKTGIKVTVLGQPPLSKLQLDAVAWSTLPTTLGKSMKENEAAAFKTLLKDAIVAKVYYIGARVGKQTHIADGSGVAEETDKPDHAIAAGGDNTPVSTSREKGQLWDLLRPLEGNCEIEFLTFDDPEGRAVFWHSSAHVLGECLECGYGCHLTVGPPIASGFFYDAYMGVGKTVDDEMKADLEKKAKKVCLEKAPGSTNPGQNFERLVISKEEALELFGENPFKVAMIKGKVPDGSFTTAYRCGPMIDLCMGPHVTSTRVIKAFAVLNASSTYFLGNTDNDTLARVYGVSFPTEERLTQHLEALAEAKENDHRQRGREQELFFFHQLSPGSAFFEPSGARVYNTLQAWIRQEYRVRGYTEVITPNIYNVDLWKTSGHWMHYAQHMFSFTDGEKVPNPVAGGSGATATADAATASSLFALKPMNCPGHCLIFAHRDRSYRELPFRMADFGVLHRNEFSGALSGLTRVRRFQQDDAHLFCTAGQVKDEVLGALNFMKDIYTTLGMSYRLERSTRPEKALGLDTPEGIAMWDQAEAALADAMNEFQGEGTWRDNPGDGAFYGPKIDIKVYDAQHRSHQCATVQLDFQLPRKFKLEYSSEKGTRETPVMVHRAMLGSFERMIAILIEHFRGRFPFWLAPRQIMVVPMLAGTPEEQEANATYARKVAAHLAEFYVDVPHLANDHHNEAMKKAFAMGYKFVLCVGPQEVREDKVSVEGRHPLMGKKAAAAEGLDKKGPLHYGICTLNEALLWFRAMTNGKVLDEKVAEMAFQPKFEKMTHEKRPAGADGKKNKGKGGGESSKSPSRSSPGKNNAVVGVAATTATAADAMAAVPAIISVVSNPPFMESGSYVVGDETYPTSVPYLLGRRFADMGEYLRFLKDAARV